MRAQMVRSAQEWRWSSYRATAGYEESKGGLTTEWILAGFADTKTAAQQSYRDFVQAGIQQPSPWQQLKNQILALYACSSGQHFDASYTTVNRALKQTKKGSENVKCKA